MPLARISLLIFCLALCSEAPAETGGTDELLRAWPGMLPIILSAPHGGRQPVPGAVVRRGLGIAQFTIGRDTNTDELTHNIAAKLEERFGAKPFMIVALFERKYVDANRPAAGGYESERGKFYYESYHRQLRDSSAQVRSRWGSGLLLDIHGQGAEGGVIYRGTNNGRTVMSLMQRFGAEALNGPKSIQGQLQEMGYHVMPAARNAQRESRYAGGYIVQAYGSHRPDGIDAIQLEFGTRLRSRASLNRTAADLADAIAVFAQEFLPIARESSAVLQGTSPRGF
jgi:N-formylglutamate amidohydrolase